MHMCPLIASLAVNVLTLIEPGAAKPAATAATPPAPRGALTEPAEGQSVRVSGDAGSKVEIRPDGSYVAGSCLIDTPLPRGYPLPTPPGVMEIKRYPLVRRAEVTGTSSPDLGSNMAFFPLFNHIKSRDIAMTAPVEMNYEGVDGSKPPPEGGDVKPTQWTMSFLYRTPEQGPLGQDEERKSVHVVDVPAVTVVALGVQGPYGFHRMRKEWRRLEVWLSEQTAFEAAGSPRVLYYNGPDRRSADKWAEVQIPIRLRAAATPAASTPAAGAPPATGTSDTSPAASPTSTPAPTAPR